MFRLVLEYREGHWTGFSNMGEVEVLLLWAADRRVERVVVGLRPDLARGEEPR